MAARVQTVDSLTGDLKAMAVSAQMPAKKKAASTPGAPVEIGTNVYKVTNLTQQPAYRYDVDIVMKLKNGKDVKAVKKDQADYMVIKSKEKAKKTFLKIKEKFPQFFSKGGLFYDCQSILFSLSKLDIKDKEPKEFALTAKDIPEEYGNVESVTLILKSVTDKYQLTLNDLAFVNTSDVKGVKHDLAQFLEVASSQTALFGGKHTTYENGQSFLMSTGESLRNDASKQLVTGCQKSVRFIEGSGKPEAAIVLDLHKSCFHASGQNLYQKAVQSVKNWPRNDKIASYDLASLNKQFKRLYVETSHGNTRQHELHGVTAMSARTQKFQVDGRDCTVLDYFAKKYNIRLQHPDAPLATVQSFFQGKKQLNFLPLEVCTVLPNQRIERGQETDMLKSQTTRLCAVVPYDRKEQTAEQAKQIGFWGNKSLPFMVDAAPLVVPGRQLPAPSIQFGKNATVTVNPANGKWQAVQGSNRNLRLPFAYPSPQAMPWAVGIIGGGTVEMGKNFARAVQMECESRGFKMRPPSTVQMVSEDQMQIGAPNNFFEAITKMSPRIKFCMFIEDERSTVHGLIKANEQKYKVITQVTTLRTVQQFNFALGPQQGYGKGQTLENICLKTHIKMGGLNHFIKAPAGFEKTFAPDRMYVGLGISHASPLTDAQRGRNMKPTIPSVIGISCNYSGAHPQVLAGSFVCQEPREDKMVEALKDVFQKLVEKFAKRYGPSKPPTPPKEVYVYRVGASDGQFASILEQEVPQIRAGLKAAGCSAKLVLVTPSKSSNVRLMPKQPKKEDKAPQQNCKPGTVVDSVIVHPMWPEFFLVSHGTLQGTAKTPRYNILVDDTNSPVSDHEMAAYLWSYGHQIVGSPTNLPTPAYIAGKYAERGRILVQQHRFEEFFNEEGQVDFEKMTAVLQFTGTPLANFRVNA